MTNIHSSFPTTAANVDEVNSIIRRVSVISMGPATGHGLDVDCTTLDQLEKCATDKGQIPVGIGHQSGAGGMCGWLCNFSRAGHQLLADWHLLKSHEHTPVILETAKRMPLGVGLSASFVPAEDAPFGKARIKELISVDYVDRPATNVGLFSRDIPAIRRIADAVTDNVDVPGTADAMNAIRYAKKPLVRRIAIKAGKVLTAGIVGHQIGKRVGSRAGAVVGGAAGLLFSAENSVETMNTNQHAKTVSRSVASHRSGHSRGLESQTVGSLDKRLKVPAGVGAALIKLGAITSRGPVMRGNNELLQFDSGELDRLQQASLSDVAEQAIDQSNGNPGELVTSAQNALADHVKQFSDPMSDAQIAAVGKKGAYGYAAGSQFLPRRSSTTYHGTEPYLKQVAEWTRKPASPGGAITKAAAAHAGEDAAKRKAALAMLATATGRYSRAARRSSRATEFSTDWIEADGPHPIRKVAGVVGGVAALVGGAAYLRGRSLAPTANPFQKIRIGSAANLATGKAVANGVSRVAAVLAGRRPH